MAYEAASQGAANADDLLRIQADMEAERANWDNLNERVAEYCFPRGDTFNKGKAIAQGELRGEKVFDATPILALDKYASMRDSLIFPDTDQWHGLETSDAALNEREDVKEFFEAATDRLFSLRYAPQTNFASQAHEYHISDGAFGYGAIFIDEALGRSLRYRCMHASEIWLRESHQGLIDGVHRKFMLRAFQVAQKSAEQGWLIPERVKKALDQNKAMAEFEFLHCVYPNDEMDPGRLDWRGMAYKSVYLSSDDKQIVKTEGFRTMPYACGRHATGPREIYGRSPAHIVLRDILMLNEMNKDVIAEAQLHLRPPILVAEEGALQPFQMEAGAINYGALSQEGNPLAVAMRPEGNMQVGLEMIQDRRGAVNDAFWINLFRILVDNPQITATEALLRAQEKGQLLGPSMGREQSETVGVMIERELDILNMAGQLPEMPEALTRELEQSGGEVRITYKAPINRLQKAGKGLGMLRTIEALTPAAQIDPSVFDAFKGKWGEIGRGIAELNDVPASWTNSEEEIAAMKEEEGRAQALDQLVTAAPQIGKTIKDISQATATANNSPRPIPYVQPA